MAAASGAASTEPRPLRGVPLRGATHLQLVVPSNPPYLLDVDTGRRTRIAGLKLGPRSLVAVSEVGRDAVLYVDRYNRPTRGAGIYLLRYRETHAVRLATAWQVAPSADGLAIWLKRYVDAKHCTLREVSLSGIERHSTRAIPCSLNLVDSGAGAVLEDSTAVFDPLTGDVIIPAPSPTRLLAIAGEAAITTERSQGPLTVTGLRTGERWQRRYPSRISGQGGTGDAAVHPDRRVVAIEYGDPAYHFTGTQVMDIWLLDLETRELRQLPDMPAVVGLKSTSMQWTDDGRLVLLAEAPQAGQNVVAVWRPGRQRIRVRPLHLPPRHSGSDSFVAWVAP
jgi:hypothetical protein